MNVFVFLVALLLPVSALAQEAIVARVIQEFAAQGVDLSGACGVFRITNEVAKRTGMKLLRKTGGWRAVPQPDGTCQDGDHSSLPDGYATDYIISLPSGVGFDIVASTGAAAWQGPEDTPDMVARNLTSWRDPVPNFAGPTPPQPPPVVVVPTPPAPVPPPAVDLQAQILAEVQATHVELQQFRAETGHAISNALEFLGKYIAPALAAFYAAWQIQNK